MQELINEIRKLIEYAGPNGKIDKKTVDKLTIKKLESIIFDLTDNLGKKQIGVALQVLRNQTFLVNKYKTQANYFTKQELRSILQALIDLDNQYKIGQIDLELGLEAIICANIGNKL